MAEVDPAEFGARVRIARQQAGLTQVQLAAAAGVSQASLSRVEDGKRGASLLEADRIADALGVALRTLLYGSQVRERVLIALRAPEGLGTSELEPGLTLLEIDAQLDDGVVGGRQQRPALPFRRPSHRAPSARGRALAELVRRELTLGDAPVMDVDALVEELTGVDVATRPLGRVSGMTLTDPERRTSLLLVNSDQPAERQRFTAAHELGHLLFDHGNRIDMLDGPSESDDEVACNEFARNLLAPREGVEAWLTRRGYGSGESVGEEALSALARHFAVSSEVMRIQLCRVERWSDASRVEPTPSLAARYGWRAEYLARQEAARQPQPPRRIVARALRACVAGAAAPALITRLTGMPVEEVEAQLAVLRGEDAGQATRPPQRFATLPTAAERLAASRA